MKKRIIALILSFLALFQPWSAYASGLWVSASCAVLMCADTGEVLYSKNPHEKRSMASTTKIMTALLAVREATPEREITVTKDMVSVEGTSMGLLPGDKVSLRELVYGMLLSSGNDAANTVACVLGGSPEGFAVMMNEQADLIGMEDTNFVTASGLDSEGHYSTAYDMALLASECIKEPLFREVCSSRTAKLSYGNPPYSRTLSNHNRLLWSCEGVIGVKTGFTRKSGRCLVSAAERDGVTLVAVTLNAPDDWNDHIRMLEYGFDTVETESFEFDASDYQVSVYGGTSDYVAVHATEAPVLVKQSRIYETVVLMSPYVYAPVNKGQILGKVLIRYGGKTVAEIPLAASADSAVKLKTVNEEKPKGYFASLFQKIKDYLLQR